MAERTYHHGDLRRALLAAAVEALAESGPAALSLRDLARRAGVSHAAPTHHFGDKAGLITALATEGYELLAAALTAAPTAAPTAARGGTGAFLELGVAYVRFATEHRAHFEVMFRHDLYHADDPELVAARARSRAALYGGIAAARTADARGAAEARADSDSGGAAAPPASAVPQSSVEQRSAELPPAGELPAGERPSAEQQDVAEARDIHEAGLAAWSLAHGFATLWLSGALPAELGDDPATAARTILRRLPPATR